MLTARLSGFKQIQEYTWRPADALARDERRADQTKQSSIFLRSPRNGLLEPVAVAAQGDLEHAAHRLDTVLMPMRLDELVRRSKSTGAHSRGHPHCPPALA
jgi:hypothetical protein